MDDRSLTYRIQLRFRASIGFTTEEKSFPIRVLNRDLTLRSDDRRLRLCDSDWFVLEGGGFSDPREGEQFGERLSEAIALTSLSTSLGVDLGDNSSLGRWNEDFLRQTGALKPHQRMDPYIHGLCVLPDDDNTIEARVNVRGSSTLDPEFFFRALSEASHLSENSFFLKEGIAVLNAALMTPEPLAKLALCLSVIDALGQADHWSDRQVQLIEKLARAAEADGECSSTEAQEVAQSLRRIHRTSLMQGVRNLLSECGLGHLKKEWSRIYNLRSGVIHGRRRLSAHDLRQLADDALSICVTIILTLAVRNGVTVPSIAKKRYAEIPF